MTKNGYTPPFTETEEITKQNKSAISKYAPIVKTIAEKPAEIADIETILLFIIYNTYYKAYPYNTMLHKRLSSRWKFRPFVCFALDNCLNYHSYYRSLHFRIEIVFD